MVASLFGFIAAAIIAALYLYDYVKGGYGGSDNRKFDLGLRDNSCDSVSENGDGSNTGESASVISFRPVAEEDGGNGGSGTNNEGSQEDPTSAFKKCTSYNYKYYFLVLHRITTGILAIIVAIIEIILLLPDSLKIPAVLRPLLDCPITRGFFYLYVGAMTFNVAGNLGSAAAVISCFIGLLVLSQGASSYA